MSTLAIGDVVWAKNGLESPYVAVKISKIDANGVYGFLNGREQRLSWVSPTLEAAVAHEMKDVETRWRQSAQETRRLAERMRQLHGQGATLPVDYVTFRGW